MKKKFITPLNIIGLIPGIAAYGLGIFYCPKNCALMGSSLTFFLICALLCINVISMLVINRRSKKMKFTAEHERIKTTLLTAEKENIKTLKSVKRIYRLSKIYMYFLIVLLLLNVFFAGGSAFAIKFIPLIVLIPLFALSGLITFVFPLGNGPDRENRLKKSKFPALFKLLKEIRKETHIHKKVRLYPIPKYSAGIHQSKKGLNIFIGSFSMGILTKNETKQILVHEYAHFHNDDTKMSLKFNRLIYRYDRCCNSALCRINSLLTALPGYYLDYKWQVYYAASNRGKEFAADKFVEKYGDKQAFINALAKITAFSLFYSEPCQKNYFAPETPPEHLESDLIKEFKTALTHNEEKWRKMIDNELPAFMSSHPTFTMRRKSMGIEGYSLTTVETDEEFIKEQEKFLNLCDKMVYNELLPNYKEIHKNKYSDSVSNIKNYEEAIKNNQTLSTQDIIETALSYEDLCNFEKGEELLNSVLKAEPDNAYALYYLGRLRLSFEHNDGIDILYRAIEENSNFTSAALELIGGYCLKMGLGDELEQYRKRSVELYQAQEDMETETGNLTFRDKLEACDLKKETFDEILSFISENGEGIIEKAYLCKKVIANDFYSYIIGIKPFKNTEPQKIDAFMDKVFLYLDLRKEQYSLFNLSGLPRYEKYLKRVENSLIYNKEK